MRFILLSKRMFVVLAAVLAALPTTAGATVQADGGPSPSFLRVVGQTLFFTTYDASAGGWALWKSDGTSEGTSVLRTGLGLDVELVSTGNRLVFSTRGALWTSDGTPEGTAVVAELPFYPHVLKRVDDDVFFSDGRGQLWRSDLTAPGTTLVKYIEPGVVFHDATPAAITNVGGVLFFRAFNRELGNELWTSDGTEAGTFPLDINPAAGSAPDYFAHTDTTLFLSADDGTHGHELWRSDGTITTLIRDINPDGDAWPRNLRVIGDTVFFSADDGTGDELWRTNGTEAGTIRVKDVNPVGGSFPNALVNVDGTLFFRADDGTNGIELWRSDGTEAGTSLVRDVNPTGSSVPANLRNVGGRLYFTADDGVHGEELWATDGTPEGTALVADLNPTGGSYPHAIVSIGDAIYLSADDGTNGTQLWKITCPSGGGACSATVIPLPSPPRSAQGAMVLVKDVNPGPADSEPYYLTGVGPTLFFQAYRPDTGIELWASDGTEAGTRLVRDIEHGPGDSYPYGFVDVNGVAYFVAYSSWVGEELWRSDGTEEGTVLVRDLVPGYESSHPRNLTPFDGVLYFSAGTGGLYRTDGTEEGTQRVYDGQVYDVAAKDDALYFTGLAPPVPNLEQRTALWRFDPDAGTASVLGSFRGPLASTLYPIVPTDSCLFFRGAGPLWRSDGTVNGTLALTGAGVNPREMTAVGDLLYFSGNSAEGRELWRSDGTPAGTYRVADINPGPASSTPGRLTNVGGTLFFWATDGTTGFELWKSDGTAPGTVLVRDIDPTDVTVPSYFKAVGNLLYFTAQNPSFGYELWRSDGTTEGTVIVRNLNLVRSSYPESPGLLGGTLFFYADDGRFGDELWALTPCGNGDVEPAEECDDGNREPGDGCNELCRIETITTTTTEPTTSSSTSTSTTVTTSVPTTSEPVTTTIVPTTTSATSTSVTTTLTPTTTSSPAPSSSTTLPAEDCGNCLDDDGDGLVDIEDPACCASSAALAIGRVRVVPHGAGSALALRAGTAGLEVGPGTGVPDVVMQLRAGDGAPWCVRIPSARLRPTKRGLRFDDPKATLPSAGGVTRLRVVRTKNGPVTFVGNGASTTFVAAPGSLDVAVAIVSPGGDAACASGTTTLHSDRRSRLREAATKD